MGTFGHGHWKKPDRRDLNLPALIVAGTGSLKMVILGLLTPTFGPKLKNFPLLLKLFNSFRRDVEFCHFD